MSHEIIHTDAAPAAIGPYSQATKGTPTLITSGQLGIVPATGDLPQILKPKLNKLLPI